MNTICYRNAKRTPREGCPYIAGRRGRRPLHPFSVGTGLPVAVPGICLRRQRSLASADRCHSLGSLHPPLAALPSLPGRSEYPLCHCEEGECPTWQSVLSCRGEQKVNCRIAAREATLGCRSSAKCPLVKRDRYTKGHANTTNTQPVAMIGFLCLYFMKLPQNIAVDSNKLREVGVLAERPKLT